MQIYYRLTGDYGDIVIEINDLNLFIQEHYETLEYLSLSGNNLTELPELPPNLKSLYCYNNHLTMLPILPHNLKYLRCCNNNLTELPILPLTLEHLYCQNNNLTELPELPITLNRLYCHNNHLIYYDFTILHPIYYLTINDQTPKPLVLPTIII